MCSPETTSVTTGLGAQAWCSVLAAPADHGGGVTRGRACCRLPSHSLKPLLLTLLNSGSGFSSWHFACQPPGSWRTGPRETVPARGTRGPASVRAVSLRATEEFGDERKTEAMGVSHRSFSDCLVLLGTVVPLLPDPVCVIAPRSSAPSGSRRGSVGGLVLARGSPLPALLRRVGELGLPSGTILAKRVTFGQNRCRDSNPRVSMLVPLSSPFLFLF